MDCSTARTLVIKRIDGELSSAENSRLDSHLAGCPSCARDYRLFSIPRRIGRAIPVLEPPPHFYTRLRARIESEDQSISIWQFILLLSRHMVPALAAVTLALISVFAYFQISEPKTDLYQVYDSIFMTGDRPQRMVIADQGDITDESVLRAIAELESARHLQNGSESGHK